MCDIPPVFVDQTVLFVLWRIVYWTSFGLTWAIIPILQTYLDQGGFDWRGKLRWAIVRQLYYFLFAGVLGIVFILYLVFKQGLSSKNALVTYLVSISNSWALVLIIGFMGYGLVDVPKRLWHRSSPSKRLEKLELEAPSTREKLIDSEHTLREGVEQLGSLSSRIEPTSPLYKTLVQIYATPGLDYPDPAIQQANISSPVTEQTLAKLHLTLKRSILQRDRAHVQWRALLQEAFHVQDILANSDFTNRRLTSSLVVLSGSKWDDWRVAGNWWLYVVLQPLLLRVASILAGILTVVIVWSELTFVFVLKTKVPVSPISLLFYEWHGHYGLLQSVSFILLIYMSFCAYSTLFQIKLFNYYVLLPDKHTDEISLLFCGAYLCRLAMPLYYNYLLLASLGSTHDSVFSELMGKMNLMPFLGEKIYKFFPFLILLPVSVAAFGLHRRLANFFSLDGLLTADPSESGRRREGRELLKSERALEERRNIFSSSRPGRSLNPTGQSIVINPPSRSIAIEVVPLDVSACLDSDNDELESTSQLSQSQQLSVSQKLRRFFSDWRFAKRHDTSDIYQSIHPTDSDLDDDDDTQFQSRNSFQQ